MLERCKNEFNQKYYDLIWKLEQENGSPRIGHYSNRPIDTGVSFYFQPENTMYLQAGLDRKFIKELAHAQQFNTDLLTRFKNDLKFIKSMFNAGIHTLETGEGLRTSHSHDYETEGTLEHEAHEIIEEEFKREINNALNPEPNKLIAKK